jgi:hypothetical protein
MYNRYARGAGRTEILDDLVMGRQLIVALFPTLIAAKLVAGPSGHWEGFIYVPEKELAVQVDLAKNEKGEWMGTIDISTQNRFPLSNVTVRGNTVGFTVKGRPGNPAFDGVLSADGQSITGNVIQGGASMLFVLKRTGDARIEVSAKGTAIMKEFEGGWQGVLSAEGRELHLMLMMANQADGAAVGTVFSMDHGGVEIPITTIAQNGPDLKIELKSIKTVYNGCLKDGVLTGEWTQNGVTLPLIFKREGKTDK